MWATVRERWKPQGVWLRDTLSRLPYSVQQWTQARHTELVGQVSDRSTSPVFVANQFAAITARDLRRSNVTWAYDEDSIRAHAENYARECARMPMLGSREDYARTLGVEPPPRRHLTDRYVSSGRRLESARWWRRQLRKAWTRSSEESMRRIGIIRKGHYPYVSEEAVRWRASQKRRMREFKSGHVAVNGEGEQLELLELSEHSVANPAIRRGEFMMRMREFEALADRMGHVALFLTLTAPSAFHAEMAAGGRNPLFDSRQTVRSAQGWLCKMWARARAKLHRREVSYYGFRIAEPHHDGTPHWHALLFVKPNAVDVVRAVVSEQWLAEFGDERGARAYRTKFETIDRTRGSAVGYLAKYIAKNIDGHGSIGEASSDEAGGKVADSVPRVEAWAAVHGIRQFQQLGGAPVGLWRECRRLREPTDDADIERCRSSADTGEWARFNFALLGHDLRNRRAQIPLKLWREETGEKDQYGECRPARVIGLCYASARVLTREDRWQIVRKGRAHALATNRVRRSPASAVRESVPVPPPAPLGSGSAPALGPVAITVRGRRYRLIPWLRKWIAFDDEGPGPLAAGTDSRGDGRSHRQESGSHRQESG